MKNLIIIPTYNEIENIEKLLTAIWSFIPDIHLLIVDDNSPDGTGEYIKQLSNKDSRVHIIQRSGKMGLGSAYKEGFRYAIDKGYDYIFEMDADFSHSPAELPKFIEKMKEYDLVIGSRYATGISVINWPLSRLILSSFANIYARKMTGVPIKDLTAGFKCYSRKVLETLPLNRIKSDGYGFQIETVFWAYRRGFKLYELPIIFVDRMEGTSKMSKHIVWEAFWIVLKLRFLVMFGGAR
ncbi:MAG: polyprenol monophosphomannose synthase [bacterium]|nr:polyprenol monophosphomannose synthase [bacterium]